MVAGGGLESQAWGARTSPVRCCRFAKSRGVKISLRPQPYHALRGRDARGRKISAAAGSGRQDFAFGGDGRRLGSQITAEQAGRVKVIVAVTGTGRAILGGDQKQFGCPASCGTSAVLQGLRLVAVVEGDEHRAVFGDAGRRRGVLAVGELNQSAVAQQFQFVAQGDEFLAWA